MITFQIAGYLTEFTGGRADIKLDGSPATVGDALQALWRVHAGLRDRVLTEQGHVRPHVNVFVGEESIRYTGGLETPVADGTTVFIVPAVSGGAGAATL